MTDFFDDMVKDSSSVFMDALNSAEAIYRPKNGPAVEDIIILYDKQLFEPDPLGGGLNERDPQITIETAILPNRGRTGYRFDINNIKVEVEHNEGDELGMTTLRVRVL